MFIQRIAVYYTEYVHRATFMGHLIKFFKIIEFHNLQLILFSLSLLTIQIKTYPMADIWFDEKIRILKSTKLKNLAIAIQSCIRYQKDII